jgi:hypothetical protein
MKLMGITLMFLFPFISYAKSSVPIIRTELFSMFGKKLCKSISSVETIDHISLWADEVFDSQIFVSILKPEKKGALSRENIELAAKIQLAKEHHRSYVYGKCRNSYAWVASFPSPVKLSDKNLSNALVANCRSYSIDTVPKTSGAQISDLIDRSNYISASVTCTPKSPKWLGPQEWFLIKGSMSDLVTNTLKEKEKLYTQPKDFNILNTFSLVNNLRLSHGLSTLKIHKSIDEISKRLSRSGSIIHNSKRFRVLSRFAKEKNPLIHKTAETRVIAKDLGEFIDLVTLSPNHRKMLLNPKADMIGISLNKVGSKTLIVIITAESIDSIRTASKKDQNQIH